MEDKKPPVRDRNKNHHGLNKKQQLFCDYLLQDPDLTPTKSYQKAFPDAAANTAAVNASRLMKKKEVRAYLSMKRKKIAHRTQIKQEDVFRECASLAFANMGDYVQWDNNGIRLVDSDQLSRAQTAAIAEITEKTTKDGVQVKIKLCDKKGAIDSLARLYGMFVDKREVAVTGITDLLQEIAANRQDSTVGRIDNKLIEEMESEETRH